jgi:lipoyl(octanoyl) transferase
MTKGKKLHWRFIDSGPGGAAFNMALDEALMREAAHGPTATLRVYGWRRSSVSLGYHQRLKKRLDPELCRASGVEIVRRITGGREVFHDRELTYSFTGPEGLACLGADITESYRLIAGGLLAALRLLGIEPEIERSPERERGLAGPCFSSASRYELSVLGKKLVGSAQRRCPEAGAFMQQGSLLIQNSQDRLLDLMPAESGQRMAGKAAGPSGRATGLEEVLGRPVEFGEVAGAMKHGFEQEFGCRFKKGQPSEKELELELELEKKYNTIIWKKQTVQVVD